MKKSLYSRIDLIIFLSVFTLFSRPLFAENPDSLKTAIINAINDGANYACDVILDKDGKSKCDYNWMEGKWYPYEPPWHTGQIIFGLVESYKITKNIKYLNNAKRAGNWWIGLEIKDHPKLKGMLKAIHGDGIENIVFATITDGTNGLFELWRVTGEEKYASIPAKAGEWMLKNMYIPEHRIFYDNVDPVTGEVMKENSPFWPDKKNQKLFDVSRPNNEGYLYKDMYEYTKDERYKKIFIELCESLVEKQGPEGVWMDFMPNNKEEVSFHPRFSLWYAESLIEGYKLTGDRRYFEAAKKTAQVFAKIQDKDGVIYYTNYINGKKNQNSICGSATSFAGILWLRLIENGVGEEFKINVERSLNFILKNRYSIDHPDKNLAGGFFETRMRSKNGKIWFTARQDIATSFGLRFLAEYYKYKFK
jgi:rhamnogalacturonyl hydrolase YesR